MASNKLLPLFSAMMAMLSLCGPPAAARSSHLDSVARDDCKIMGDDRQPNYDIRDAVALMAAIRQNDWDQVRAYLILKIMTPFNLTPEQQRRVEAEGVTAGLIRASARGDLKTVARLLKAGGNPNVATRVDDYATPLAWAAKCEHPAVVRLLIAGGADVNERLYDVQHGAIEEGGTALIWASESGAWESVAVLLSHHAKVGLRARDVPGVDPSHGGFTALEAAHGRKIMRMLLKAGADPRDLRRNPWSKHYRRHKDMGLL